MNSENNPIRIVLDTNVLVSAFSSGGIPAKALQVSLSPTCELVVSDFILEELERVLILKLNHSQSIGNTRIITPKMFIQIIESL